MNTSKFIGKNSTAANGTSNTKMYGYSNMAAGSKATPKAKAVRMSGPSSLAIPSPFSRWGDTINSVAPKPKTPKKPSVPKTGMKATGGLQENFDNSFVGAKQDAGISALLQALGDTGNQFPTTLRTGTGTDTTSGWAGTDKVDLAAQQLQDYSSYGDLVGGGPGGNFADQYTPLANAQGFYDHPDVLAADLLASMGITNPEMIDMIANQADLAYALQLVLQGSPNGSDQTNFIADYLTQMMTPGGQIPSYEELMGILMGADSNSMSGQYQSQADPSGMNNLIMSLLGATTGNPYYSRAVKGGLDQSQRNYYSDSFKGGEQGTYADFMRQGSIPGLGR